MAAGARAGEAAGKDGLLGAFRYWPLFLRSRPSRAPPAAAGLPRSGERGGGRKQRPGPAVAPPSPSPSPWQLGRPPPSGERWALASRRVGAVRRRRRRRRRLPQGEVPEAGPGREEEAAVQAAALRQPSLSAWYVYRRCRNHVAGSFEQLWIISFSRQQ